MPKAISRLHFAPILAVVSVLAITDAARASDLPASFSGSLLGMVYDSDGTPQMGAAVNLYDRYDRLLRKTFSGADGRFGFGGLTPSYYSIKVSAASLVPALRSRIVVHAGLSSMLQIHLATLASDVELGEIRPLSAMTDDWKLVLRSSPSTRSVLRAVNYPAASSSPENPGKVFKDTRGLVSLSGGEAGSSLSDSGLGDLGTAFAVSTTIYDRTRIGLSGAFGQSMRSGMPTAALRATYARTETNGVVAMPEFSLTAQQVILPQRAPLGTEANETDVALRTAVLSYYDTMEVLDTVHLEYGSSVSTLSYGNMARLASPFLRATSSLGRIGSFAVVLSDGGQPIELYAHQYGEDADFTGAMRAMNTLPQFSRRDGRVRLQQSANVEVGYSNAFHGGTYSVSGFYESVTDGRMNVTGDLSPLPSGDVIADVSTNTSIYNLGNYRRHGVVASVDQRLNDNLSLLLAVGTMGGFTRGSGTDSPESLLRQGDHGLASIGMRTTVPKVKTRISGNYELVSGNAILPRYIFATQQLWAEPGLNLSFRQPLPSLFGLGKLELSGDVKNLLAQGYLPVATGNGRQFLLVQAPRALRGGLNIVF